MLNKSQQKAVDTTSPLVLVSAGPGTGKTHTMTQRIVKQIKDGVSPYNILAITFTNKAATELRERVRSQVGNLPHLSIETFHSAFFNIMSNVAEKFGYKSMLTIYDEADTNDVMEAVKEKLLYSLPVSKMLAMKTRKYQDLISPATSQEKQIISEYERILFQNCAVDFDQILYLTYDWLQTDQGFRDAVHHRYRHIYIDEFQDTNLVQAKIIELIDPENLYVIGDVNQSIYGWRNADIDQIIALGQKPGCENILLDISYRCPPEILVSAHKMICHNKKGDGSLLYAVKNPNPRNAEAINFTDFERMVEWLKSSVAPAIDTGILTRTNRMAEEISEALKKAEIEHSLFTSSDRKLFTDPVARALLSYFKSCHNVYDSFNLRKLLKLPQRDGINQRTLNEMVLQNLKTGVPLYGVFKERFPDDPLFRMQQWYMPEMEVMPPLEALTRLVAELDLFIQFKDTPNKVETLKKFLQRVASWQENTTQLANMPNLIRYLTFRDIQDSEEKPKPIKVMTIHASKGLEFDWVILAGMVEGLIPSTKGDIEEERRLAYVGWTRGKERATALSYEFNFKPAQPSRFIKEMGL